MSSKDSSAASLLYSSLLSVSGGETLWLILIQRPRFLMSSSSIGRPDEKFLQAQEITETSQETDGEVYKRIEVLARAILPLLQLWLGELVDQCML